MSANPPDAMPPKVVVGKIINHIGKKYSGSNDLEVFDACDFCQYFGSNYGTEEGKAHLKELLQNLEAVVARLSPGWNPAEPLATVLEAPLMEGEDIPEFWLAPWQAGFTEMHSVKGKSKQCYVVETAQRFLTTPYNSKAEPLRMLFGPSQVPGQPLPDWSMVHDVGMGKNSALRMVLEAIAVMMRDTTEIAEADLVPVAPMLRAMFRVKAVYDPAHDPEAQSAESIQSGHHVLVIDSV